MEKDYPAGVRGLPIAPHLDAICGALLSSPSRFLVLTAETAAGKSTAMPLALLRHVPGGVLMLEPRRLAVLNIAGRVAELLREDVGQTCGYAMRLERRTSARTRFTVLTEAILTRRLQSDPALEGISVVVIDEFHERSIHADLALAFLKEAMTLRDDLYVVVMSATIDAGRLSQYLGTGAGAAEPQPCPVYAVPGRQFPVQTEYAPGLTVAQAVARELRSSPPSSGSILAFLPGIGEIRRAQRELAVAAPGGCDVLVLHSSVPLAEQRMVLQPPAPGSPRRVILSSAIAETSLTVPDVRVVIDSGLARVNVFNQGVGMESLVTQGESEFNARQRAGRAGRTAPGRCVRLWSQGDPRVPQHLPEILRADLVPLVLECAEWGVAEPGGLDWLDAPPRAAWQAAAALLEQLGCLRGGGITELGRACLLVGLHPRLACVALSGAAHGAERVSTEAAMRYAGVAPENARVQSLYAADLMRRVRAAAAAHGIAPCLPPLSAAFSPSYALLCGYPDRVAVRTGGDGSYQFPSGRVAALPADAPAAPPYIIAPDVDAGERAGRIRAYEPLAEGEALDFMLRRARVETEASFAGEGQKLQKTEYTRYGRIVLKQRRVPVQDGDYIRAVCARVAEKGLDWLPLSAAARNFLLRAQFYAQHSPPPADGGLGGRLARLAESAAEWLPPFVPPRQTVTAEMVYAALACHLDGDRVNRHVPAELVLPNGRRRRLEYETHDGTVVPTLEIIIQQIFGCFATPRVMGVPVLLKLLSPARRPLQITSDLEHFWQETWPQICSEMKGRYPRHNWDYRVTSSGE